VFTSCPTQAGCPHCGEADGAALRTGLDWGFVDGVYCISLRHREDRARDAARELHRIGLCARARFYRPMKDRQPKRGCWESHCAVAADARARGLRRVLILEDDVVFPPALSPETVARVGAALARLPVDWLGFYLGHWARWAVPVDRDVVRCSSLCTHAYVASERLITWLCETPYETGRPRGRRGIGGKGIDTVFSQLPGMYAFSPLIAVQRLVENDHLSAPRIRLRPLKSFVIDLFVRSRVREYALAYAMGWNERLVIALTRMGAPGFRAPRALRKGRETLPAELRSSSSGHCE
jgi:hypothetical protein